MKLIPYGRQHITDEEIKAVGNVLRSDFITTGPVNQEFEERLAKFFHCRFAVVFNSGTSALHGAYFALGTEAGSEFITSPNTFVATGNAGLYLNLKPVFCDVEEDTGNICANLIEEKITGKTRFIVPVHYAGHPADMESISRIAENHGLKIIEDASHAAGAEVHGTKTGDCKYSEMSVFSFHPVKHITTGEGGAVLTNHESYYRKLKMFRSHGITKEDLNRESEGDWYYEMHYLGHNYRMTDFQAALGIAQLEKMDRNVKRRREIAAKYRQVFDNNPWFDLPAEKDYARSSFHLYPVRIRDKSRRKALFDHLRRNQIGVQVHYIPVYHQPYYAKLGYTPGLCPVAEDFYQREISIPMFPVLTDDQQDYVIEKLKEFFMQ